MTINNSHIGKTCPYCQFPIKQDSEVTVCSACKVPHHRECWEENGGCTTFGCNETTSRLIEGEKLDVSFDDTLGQQAAAAHKGGTNKLLAGALVTALVVIAALGGYIIMGINEQAISPDPTRTDTDEPDQPDYPVFDDLDADYYIDYDNGTIPIGDLPIGTRVVDPSWEWEYRLGVNYSDEEWDGDPTPPGEVKPVTWIVVTKDHYEGLEPHVTLLSKELIGRFPFDNSTDRDHERAQHGYNHWGESGTGNATHGLRPWLNSTGIHAGEGFYRAFSESFKQAVLTTTVPNKEWQNGTAYSTKDHVFIPSTTELGERSHNWTYQIGIAFPYFSGADNAKRMAMLGREAWWYWTRSPQRVTYAYPVRDVSPIGGFCANHATNARSSSGGVRPALNLKSEILVSEIKN